MKRTCSLKNLMIAIFLLCAVICITGVIKADFFPDEDMPPITKPAFEKGWTYQIGARQGRVDDFPFVKKSDADSMVLTNTLPNLNGSEYLAFANQYNSCQVFVDGVKIYDYGEEISAPYGAMLGNMSCNVPLKSRYSGKMISVRLKKQYDFAIFNVQEMLLGSGGEIRFYYARSNIGVLGCTLLLFVLSVAMFTLYLVQRTKRFKYNYELFFHLSVVAFIGAVWILTDSLLPQFLFGNTIIVTILSFWSFMAMPIPVINIVCDLCHYGKKTLHLAEKIILLNMILQTVLYMLNIADFSQMLPATHIILLFSLASIVYALARESRNKEAAYTNGILFAVFVLVLFGLAALVNFYVTGASDNNSLYYRWGIVIFVVLLAIVNIKRMGAFLEEWEQNRMLGKLAFMDVMTKTNNRSAYERYMDDNADVDVKKGNFSLALMDLNDLKALNDTYGHNAGDQALIEAARCIKDVLGGEGQVYRIGGDEFVVIMEGRDIDGKACQEKLMKEIADSNQKAKYPFAVAFGFASARGDDCADFDELQKKADLNMYVDKQKYKKSTEKG